MNTHHALRPPARRRVAAPAPRLDIPAPMAPTWPSYTGASQYVGTSADARVVVYVDPTLGPEAAANALALVQDAPRIVCFNDGVFNSSEGVVSVIIFAIAGQSDGTGGADHGGCDYASGGAIEVCASFGAPMRVSALFEAELSECNMGGSLCGLSTGEALSRWCALAVSGNALDDFSTAPTWYADATANFVDATDPTDLNPDSVGCGMAFLSWLQSMGFALVDIAHAMVQGGDGATLAGVYATLTGDAASNAWPSFLTAVNGLSGVTTDDPFSGVATPMPTPAPVPAPPSPSGPVTLDQAVAWATAGLTENWPSS